MRLRNPPQETVMLSRRAFAASAATIALTGFGLARPALAQSNPIILIVPFAPGGPTDVIGRIAADGISRRLGERVVVENVAGAGGATGVLRAARAAPDGRTLVIGNLGTHGAAPSAMPNLPYDPIADFEPVGLIASTPIVLVARPNFPAATLAEFAAALKAAPNRYTYGHAGIGVTSHTAAQLLLSSIMTMQTGVTYRGTAQALTDLLGGTLDFICDQSVIMVEQVRGGTVKALAVASPSRLPSLPDVPTSAEGGLPDFVMTAWNGLFAPRGADGAAVARLNAALRETLASAEAQERLKAFDAEAPQGDEAGSPQALKAHVEREVARWRKVL
jgi:tripartite-type tricarboxylate transporter receptor subunit TctC